MKEIRITSADASQRFDKYLKRILPEMGTSFMYKMLRKKNILNRLFDSGAFPQKTATPVSLFARRVPRRGEKLGAAQKEISIYQVGVVVVGGVENVENSELLAQNFSIFVNEIGDFS